MMKAGGSAPLPTHPVSSYQLKLGSWRVGLAECLVTSTHLLCCDMPTGPVFSEKTGPAWRL